MKGIELKIRRMNENELKDFNSKRIYEASEAYKIIAIIDSDKISINASPDATLYGIIEHIKEETNNI